MSKLLLFYALALSLGPVSLAEAQADSTIWFVEPRWSPDGKALMFAAGPSGRLQVFRIDATGSGIVRVACSDSTDSLAEWSPDGKAVMFTSRRTGSSAVFRHDLATNRVSRVSAANLRASRPKWSPDGKRIAFTVQDSARGSNAWTVAADGRDARPLTSGVNRYTALGWSPDGSRLLISSADSTGITSLWLQPIDGSTPTPLVRRMAGTVYEGSWSPDGRRIAFDLDVGSQADIHVINVDGSGLMNVTNHPSRDYLSEWSHDGNRLVFYSTRERRRYHFYELDVTSGVTRRIDLTQGWTAAPACLER